MNIYICTYIYVHAYIHIYICVCICLERCESGPLTSDFIVCMGDLGGTSGAAIETAREDGEAGVPSPEVSGLMGCCTATTTIAAHKPSWLRRKTRRAYADSEKYRSLQTISW